MGLPMGTQLFDFQRVLTSQDIDLPHPTGQWNLAAGGDTSFAWIQAGDQVRAWAWGNNEYGQCLVSDAHAGDVGTGAAAALHSPDQLPFPVEVTQAIQQALGSGRRLADVKVGGSWLALLDGESLFPSPMRQNLFPCLLPSRSLQPIISNHKTPAMSTLQVSGRWVAKSMMGCMLLPSKRSKVSRVLLP